MKTIAKFLLALMLSIPLAAQAEMVNLQATLSGEAERPTPVTTSATGAAGMVLDTDTGDFSWNIRFSGLSSPMTVAHFHGPAGVDESASPALNLFPSAFGVFDIIDIATDGLSGSFLGSTTLDANVVADILDELWYVNIHSETFPGGELRGQIFKGVASPVPLPAAVWLFGSALGILGWARRRQI